MLVLNLPFKALMFLTLMRPSLVLFLVLWLKLVKDFLKVRCRLALLPFLISCLIWLDLVASLPLIKERILVIQRNQSAAFSSGKVRPNHETNINIIARRTGKDVNSHTVLDGIITTIMATIQR